MSVFAGEFSLNAAVAVVAHFEATAVMEDIAGLVSKSLVAAELRSGNMRYRLLETTRIYCGEKLRLAGELASARRAYAAYMLDIFATAETDAARLPTEEWMENYASQLDNVRTALDWAASNEGDTALLVALTIAAVPLWVQLSLMAECRARAKTALGALDADDDTARLRMQLYAALGWSMMYASARASEVGLTWAATLDLANRLGDNRYRLRAIWGVWISKLNSGDLDAALELAQQLIGLVEELPNETDRMMADRLMATTLHFRGDQDEARRFIERMFSRYARAGPQPRIAQFHVDQQVTARYFQARILWLQGHVDQAVEAVERNIQEGEALGHALAFGSVLGQAACPIALFTGDFPAARRYAAVLLDHSEKHGLHLWHVWAQCFDGLVRIKQGDIEPGLDAMRAALDAAGDAGFLPRYMVLRAECAMALGQAGDLASALETIDDMLRRCELSRERWYVPEVMRLRGEVLILTGSKAAAEEAAMSFESATRLAGEQGARSWQLRAAPASFSCGTDRRGPHWRGSFWLRSLPRSPRA
jgi:predicted ATPase